MSPVQLFSRFGAREVRVGIVLGIAVGSMIFFSARWFQQREQDQASVPSVSVVSTASVQPKQQDPNTQAVATLVAPPDNLEPKKSPIDKSQPAKFDAKPRAKGTLQINTTPYWAEVFLEGKKLGTTPRTGQVEVGSHEVILRPEGDASRDEKITIEVTSEDPNRIPHRFKSPPAEGNQGGTNLP